MGEVIDDAEVDLQIVAEKLGIDILTTRCVDSHYISDLALNGDG